LSLKIKVDDLSVVWPQNHWDGLSVVWPQNYWDGFLHSLKIGGDGFLLASKPMVTVSPGLASKLVARVFRFGHQNWQLRFSDLILKITATISWFVPQNQASYGLSVAPQND
jgi:hypothetical protein